MEKGILQSNAQPSKWQRYLQEFKDELKKVTWTSKDELRFFTKIVVGATFVFGIGIYVVDLLIKISLDVIKTSAHWLLS
jgi:preprotein translocase subunit SecE